MEFYRTDGKKKSKEEQTYLVDIVRALFYLYLSVFEFRLKVFSLPIEDNIIESCERHNKECEMN